jgi:hypothetical protein
MATGKATWPDMEANTGPSSSIKSTHHYWQRELGRDDFAYGQFGENFTIEGLSDQECALAIATGLAKLCSRSHSRASPVTAWAFV